MPSYAMAIVELAGKFEPVTVTVVPARPELGLRVIDAEAVTVKVAVLPVAPLAAWMVLAPCVAVLGITIVAEKPPDDVVVMEAGFVAIEPPLNVTATVELGG